MTTEAQIHANRSNAQNSTGPRTQEGKAAVSQNAVKHGLLAHQNVISSESQEEFDLHRNRFLEELAPATPMESFLADRIVSLTWRLKRAEIIQNQAIDALDERNDNSPFAKLTKSMLSRLQPAPQDAPEEPPLDIPLGRLAVKDCANYRVLDRLLMYERRIENSLHKTILELQRLKLIKNINTENQASSIENQASSIENPASSIENQPVSAPGILPTRALGKNISESSVPSVATNKNMQNKPNLLETQMNVSAVKTKDYENKHPFRTLQKQTQLVASKRKRRRIHAKTNPTYRGETSGEAGFAGYSEE